MADVIKMDIVLERARILELVPNYEDPGDRQVLVDTVAEKMGFASETGGWVWKVSPKSDGTSVRLIGRFVPVGENILA